MPFNKSYRLSLRYLCTRRSRLQSPFLNLGAFRSTSFLSVLLCPYPRNSMAEGHLAKLRSPEELTGPMVRGHIMSEEGSSGDSLQVTQQPRPPPMERHHQKGEILREPISARLGVDYAFPPHLEYAYPPPDGHILTNIVNALIAVPRFYTQVLHLMNKMSLPAPFRPALPTPPLPPPAVPSQPLPKRHARDLSSGESELESSDEEELMEENKSDANEGADRDLMGVQTVAGQKKGEAKKRVKREAIVGPAVDKGVTHEAAGVKAIVVPTIIKKKAPVLQIKIAPKASTSGDMELGKSKAEEASQVEPAAVEGPDEQLATASREELEAGKLQTSEMLSLPILKKYTTGNPAPVLYIKNLAKDVTTDDMYYIYGAFFPNRTTAMEQLSVKVMQEGRMRGQAFVTLPSTELAEVALAGTHGFVFKGKPMIVQYGRSQEAVAKTS